MVASPLAAQPGLEHHHDLVERPRALVVRRNQEQHAAAGGPLWRRRGRARTARARRACSPASRSSRRARRVPGSRPGACSRRWRSRACRSRRVRSSSSLTSCASGSTPVTRALHEVDMASAEWLCEVDEKVVGVGAERDVDRVGSERERLAFGDERQIGPVTQPHPQQEGGLETGEAGAEDHDAGPFVHHSEPGRPTRIGHPQLATWQVRNSPHIGVMRWRPAKVPFVVATRLEREYVAASRLAGDSAALAFAGTSPTTPENEDQPAASLERETSERLPWRVWLSSQRFLSPSGSPLHTREVAGSKPAAPIDKVLLRVSYSRSPAASTASSRRSTRRSEQPCRRAS